MSAKHTPGPWITNEADHDAPYQDIKIKAGKHHTVCTVWIDDAPVHDFNALQEANARLIAAAPDLLEAAKQVLAWYEAEDGHSKVDFYERVEMCRKSEAAIRAAIAKAEGTE